MGKRLGRPRGGLTGGGGGRDENIFYPHKKMSKENSIAKKQPTFKIHLKIFLLVVFFFQIEQLYYFIPLTINTIKPNGDSRI